MACSLFRDASGKFDFTSKQHSTSDISASATQGTAKITSARFNGDAVTVNNNVVHITIDSGVNVLTLSILAPPEDTVTVFENCGGGQTQVLEKFQNTVDPQTGAPDPETGFSIFGF